MFKKRLTLALGLATVLGAFSSATHAGTMVLDSFVDQSPATIDLPATQLLMATINTSGTQGGNDADATAVSIGGTIVAADVAEVCVDYNGVQVACQTNPGNLANISISLGGNQKGGTPFDYRITLNPSAAGKTIQLTVLSITNTNLADNIPLPASTATRTVAGGAVAPTVTTPTFADVTDTTATLGGTLTDDGGDSGTTCGVEWGTTPGGPYPNPVSGVSCSVGVPFTTPVTGLPASTQIYFRATATNSAGSANSVQNTFTTADPIVPPTVTVTPAANIGQNSATLGGNVTDAGNGTVTDRGIVWNTTSPAETGGTSVSMGSGVGSFSQLVSGLPAGTQIFFKAYATNSAGTAYSGTEESFTTLVGLPTVDSPTVTDITATTATLGGTMSSDGGQAPSDCGVEWGTSFGGPYPNPESFGICSEGAPFTVPVTGLPTGTVVYFRAYATNTAGTAYSAQVNFTPAGAPVVTATPATNILLKSAILGGEVTSDGGSNVTGRGIVWDTVSPPEAAGTVVPMGTGIGVFSQTVSGLPAATQIFWKAYATNAQTTGYSAQESFTTLSEPTVQASNLNFGTVSGRSLRITWTRGNGDGVIVVMRLAATVRTDPQDGDDYTGNPDFSATPPELPVNSSNFVVYKGPATSVIVTGLTFTTDYTVAVYEYAGTGTGTDYLLTPLVEATQQTTDYAVHNYDFGITCDQCHNHGSFGSRDAELKDICLGCHVDLGVAEAKQEFDNHTTPTKNPGVDFVDCGVCHELHNLSATDTTESFNSITSQTQHNKSFLRANVDKYITTAATPAFLHTDQPKREEGNLNGDPVQPAVTPERAVEGGDATTARGYCQVCHTQTNYHRNNAAATDPSGGGRPGLMQCHDGDQNDTCTPEVHCGDCHEHNNRFVGVNNNLPCEQCHDQVQGTRPVITTQFDGLSSHIPGGSTDAVQDNCMVCHDQGGHTGGVVSTFDADDNGTSYAQPTAGADTRATGEGEAFAPHCLSCHDSNGAASLPGTGDQTPTSPFTGSGAPPVIDNALWTNAGHNRPVATFPSTPVSCVGGGANGCHSSGHGTDELNLLAPIPTDPGITAKASIVCTECHKPGGVSSKDIRTEFDPAAGATDWQVTSGSGAAVNQRHDIFDADQTYSGGAVTCSACHSVHADNTTNNTVLNPATGTAIPAYNPASYGPGADPLNPVGKSGGGFTEPDYIEYCLVCHGADGGTSPLPGVTMTTGLRNISIDWANDQHGQGSGFGSGNGFLKYPYNTNGSTAEPTTAYASMNCTTCHGAHGTGNIFNLRESITVAGEPMTIGGWAGDTIGTLSGTTYTLPIVTRDNIQEDHYWGAWCSFCHQHEAHGRDEDVKCTSGHMHGGNQF